MGLDLKPWMKPVLQPVLQSLFPTETETLNLEFHLHAFQMLQDTKAINIIIL